MITSVSPSEGKTTVAVQLAIAHAQQNNKTLLIDGDMRRPGVHAKLGVQPKPGSPRRCATGFRGAKTDAPGESSAADGATGGADVAGVRCIIGTNLKTILAAAETEYDLIVVDSPPALGFSEPLQMAAAVSGWW